MPGVAPVWENYEEYERRLYRGNGSGDVSGDVSDGMLLKAKASCYGCLWETIESVLSIPRTVQSASGTSSADAGQHYTMQTELFKNPTLVHSIVLSMVSRVTNSTDDVELHNILYSKLYEWRAQDVLVQLEANVFFEDYFRQVDPGLLYK